MSKIASWFSTVRFHTALATEVSQRVCEKCVTQNWQRSWYRSLQVGNLKCVHHQPSKEYVSRQDMLLVVFQIEHRWSAFIILNYSIHEEINVQAITWWWWLVFFRWPPRERRIFLSLDDLQPHNLHPVYILYYSNDNHLSIYFLTGYL